MEQWTASGFQENGQTELLQEVLPLLAKQTPQMLQEMLNFLHSSAGQGSMVPESHVCRGFTSISLENGGPSSQRDGDGWNSPVISADPNLMFSPKGAPDVLVEQESILNQGDDEGPHLIEPQPRDLDLSDPNSIETSLTAIHRSIDCGFELSNIMRSCSSFSSLHSCDDMSNHCSEESTRSRCVSPLTRSLSSAIFHRRLAFRAKKEEFYPETDRDPLVIVTVGLPARGKSYVARRLCRYMGWKGVPCRIFNAGNYRRMLLGADQHADFFDATNKEAKAAREKMAQMAADDLIEYIRQGGQIGIFDATNTTRMRRQHVLKVFTHELGLPVNRIIFLEMVCNDKKMVEHNILEVKLKGKDYEGVDPTAAYADFKNREAEYMKVYETLELNNEEDKRLSFVKVVDAGDSLVTHRIVGALPKSLIQFAGLLKPFAGHLYVTVNGETHDMIAGRLGVNSDLAPSGKDLARRLEAWADKLGYETMHVWCAPTNTGMQTAQPFLSRKKKFHVQVWRALMDIDYGKFQGKTYYEVQKHWPRVWEALQRDEYFYTWPGGESPCALVQRLDPILMAMEGKTAPILIICSRTVCRAILSYCCDLIPEQFTRIKLPKNVIFDIDMNAEPVRVNTLFV